MSNTTDVGGGVSDGECTLFNGSAYKCNTIIMLKRVTASLSIIGCLFMIAVIWLFRKYRVQSQRLVLWLSVAALFDALAYAVGDIKSDGALCDAEAWFLTWFDWCVLAWVCCITFNLYTNAVRMRTIPGHHEKYFHLVCWLCPPLLLSLLPFAGDHYGPAGAWCWIKHEDTAWRFAVWYVPLFVAITALFITFAYITYQIKRRFLGWQNSEAADDHAALLADIKVLRSYPFIYLTLSLFPLILRIHNAFTAEGDDVYGLWIMTVLTAPLQGAVNAIVFGLDPDTRSKVTWNQVKMAWGRRFDKSSAVQEYPTMVSVSTPYQKYDNDEAAAAAADQEG